jgi:hypothetical protein
MTKAVAYDVRKLIAGSESGGWRLGYIGVPWPGPWPKRSGDLFVSDPTGGQAGIAWEGDGPDILEISGPSQGRWGVFQVRFPIAVMSPDDLIRNFHAVLPLLKQQRARFALTERFYAEILVRCDAPTCREVFVASETPQEPIEAWAKRAAAEAETNGWSATQDDLVVCPKHCPQADPRE